MPARRWPRFSIGRIGGSVGRVAGRRARSLTPGFAPNIAAGRAQFPAWGVRRSKDFLGNRGHFCTLGCLPTSLPQTKAPSDGNGSYSSLRRGCGLSNWARQPAHYQCERGIATCLAAAGQTIGDRWASAYSLMQRRERQGVSLEKPVHNETQPIAMTIGTQRHLGGNTQSHQQNGDAGGPVLDC